MAAFMNRTVSMMGGDGPHNRSPLTALTDHRQLRGSAADNSPLQIFVKAKKKINDIFVEIADYVTDTVDYMKSKNTTTVFPLTFYCISCHCVFSV